MPAPEIQVYRDTAGEWRWRLVARNGRTLAQGEGHPRKAHALRAAATFREAAARAAIVSA